jgi:hypothetical protein
MHPRIQVRSFYWGGGGVGCRKMEEKKEREKSRIREKGKKVRVIKESKAGTRIKRRENIEAKKERKEKKRKKGMEEKRGRGCTVVAKEEN